MPNLTTLEGGSISVSEDAVTAFGDALEGDLLTPESAEYDEARTLWNDMIDRRPGLIVACQTEGDVSQSVKFAAEHGVLLSIFGAGHNIAGNAVCDGGLMISFRNMRAVDVDPSSGTVRVEPGATLGDLDAATQAHALAVPTGINSTTGIAGLTLGGGFGWLSRKYGMTIDNLRSVRVVLADGSLVVASESENSDLFWGLRGGGGNFGVVTSFEFQAHPVGPEVLAGLIVHPFSDGPEVLREVVVLAAMYAGDISDGEVALAPLRGMGNPIADVIGPQPFVGWQQAFDPLLTPGERNYWKTHDFDEMSDEMIDTALGYLETLPDPQSDVFFAQMGGAQGRVSDDATAYQGRGAEYVLNVHGRWSDASQDESCIAWCRDLWNAMGQYATGEAYVNFMTEEEGARLESAYGSSYQRLVELKNRYDPTNLFRLNQNIPPTV